MLPSPSQTLTHCCVCYRFFFHSDKHNPLIYSLDEFASHIVKFTPDLLVIGGLQMMDNFPFDEGRNEFTIIMLKVCYIQ